MKKKYNVSIENYSDIKSSVGCYLKYDKSYMDLVSDNECESKSYDKWFWMFGHTTVSFAERNQQELRLDSSTISNGYEHIAIIKMDRKWAIKFESIFKNINIDDRQGNKEIWKCDLKDMINCILRTIDEMERWVEEFQYEICIINGTRYTEKLKDLFGIKRTPKRYSQRYTDIVKIYRHRNGMLYRYNESADVWSLNINGGWMEYMSFMKFVSLVRNNGYSITNNKGANGVIKLSKLIED